MYATPSHSKIPISAVLLSTLLWGLASSAQTLPANCPPKPSQRKAAKALANKWFKRAERFYGKERFTKSVSAFRCSLRMVEHPVTYFNAAQAAIMAEDKESALEFYRRNLEMAPDGPNAADVAGDIAELEQAVEVPPEPEEEVIPEPVVAAEPVVETEPVPEPIRQDHPPDVVLISGSVLTGLGGAGVIVGIVLQGMAGKAKTDSEEAEWLADYQEAKDQMISFQTGAYVGLIAGGTLLVTGVSLLIASSVFPNQCNADLALYPTPSGVVLQGKF